MLKSLDFRPFPGLASPHAQMIMANFTPPGKEVPSTQMLVSLSNEDQLSCQVSTPPNWQRHHQTVVLVHGMGGHHLSSYMIRLSRKFYQIGTRVIRINLRGCGSGKGLSQLPYHCGNSHDVQTVLEQVKTETPSSPLHLIGFSLGGNICLKLAGELGEKAFSLIEHVIAVCPVLEVIQTILSISQKKNLLYHKYYVKQIVGQGQRWLQKHPISSIYEYDEKFTAPLWGFSNAVDYYEKCSSARFIHNIQVPCDLILAADDPFIDFKIAHRLNLQPKTTAWITPAGGHMGFLGWGKTGRDPFWMDQLLLNWVSEK